MLKNIIDIVIYHNYCPDGFTSATIANLYAKKQNIKFEFMGLSHSGFSQQEIYEKTKNKNVLICDFSFKKDMTLQLIKNTKNLLIIDHHLSAQKELQDIEDKYKIFDMKHCGAYLTWKYFFDTEPGLFIKYIEDNDIWIKEMPNTLEMTEYISMLEYKFEEYEKFILNEGEIYKVIEFGKILLKQSQKNIDSSLNKSTVKMIDFNNNIYFVGICNATCNINEIGNQLLTKFKHIDFSLIYSINTDNNTNVSLRSDEKRADVSVISSKCGGGGHKCASGMSLYNKNNIMGFEIGDINSYKQLKDLEFTINYAIKGKKYNVVMLNTTQNKSQFAKYLLQTRYKNENNEEIQECSELYKEKYNLENVKFDFAVTWHYGDKKTWFVVHWKDEHNIKLLFGDNDNYEIFENKKIAKFSIDKLNFF